MRHRLITDAPRLAQVAGLALATLLLGLFIALPLGHQLFHEGPVESETCPVRMLESSLVLLFIVILSLLFLHSRGQERPAVLRSVSLPLFRCGFFFGNRAPPHS